MNRGRPRAAASAFRWGAIDQALSSLSNFGLNLCVAHYVGLRSLGEFSVAFAVYFITLSCSRALNTDALVVRFSHAPSEIWRSAAGRATGGALASGLVVGVVCAAVGVAIAGSAGGAIAAVGLALPGLLLQDSWRYAFVASGRAREAARNDLVWAMALVPGLALYVATSRPTVAGFIAVWGAAGCAAALFGISQARLRPRPAAALAWWAEQRDLGLRYLGESLGLGVGLQLSVFGIGAVAGIEAVGTLRAGLILFSPFYLIVAGAQLVGVTEGVRALGESVAALRRVCARILLALTLLALLSSLIVVGVPASLGRSLMGANWESARSVIVPFTFSAVAAGATAAAVIGLRATAAARVSLRVSLITAPVVLVGGPLGGALGGTSGAIWGAAAATAVGAVATWVSLTLVLTRPRPDIGTTGTGATGTGATGTGATGPARPAPARGA